MSDVSATGSSALRTLAQRLLQTERRPLQSYEAQKSSLEDKRKVYRGLAARLSDLKRLTGSFSSVTSTNPLRAIKVTGSDDAKLGVSASASASPGAHTVRVEQIAQRHTLASRGFSQTGDELSALSGNGFRFRLESAGETVDVAVELEGDLSDSEVLAATARAINNATSTIDASVISTSEGQSRLLVQASATGRDARLTALTDSDGRLLESLGLAGAEVADTPPAATVQTGTDAELNVDGLPVRSNSNELVGVLPGVNLTLHGVTDGTRSFRVERDVDAVASKVDEWIKKYNDTLDEVRNLTRASDSEGQNRGTLAGEGVVTRLRAEMRSAVSTGAANPEAPFATLAAVGIAADREGRLSIKDRKAFDAALAENPKAVEALWNGEAGIARRLESLLDRYAKTGGVLAVQTNTLDSRIRSVQTRIRKENESLTRREDTLLGRLTQLESSLTALSSQQQYLGGLLGSSDGSAG